MVPRKYIIDESNRRVAVQLDIETFEKMEEIIENYGLVQFMKEVEDEEPLTVKEAKQYYDTLKKAE
jgi:acetyl-CoA carboxylase beta subunit